jgi:DNA repair protein RadD
VTLKLRPYQVAALSDAAEHIRAGRRRVLLAAPTGAGKTSVAAALVLQALERGERIYFLAHRRELIVQPYERFRAAGVPAHLMAIVKGGRRTLPAAPVQIISVQALARRDLPPPSIIVIDEAHRSLAKQYLAALERWPDAIVIGLTATPTRTDRRGLGEVYQALVEVASYAELVAGGYLVAPRVFTTGKLPDVSSVRTVRGDFDERELAHVCDRAELVGDIVGHYRRRGDGRPAIAFAASVEHSRHLCEAFASDGWRCLHVDGTTPDGLRDGAWRGLADGAYQVVCNYGVAIEGVDVPEAAVCIMARPTQSVTVYLQSAGRVSRPAPGKAGALLLDHAGNAMRHGHPVMDREWSLEPPPKRKKRGGIVLPPCWTCETCMAVVAMAERFCPECWSERPRRVREMIRQVEGELVELSASVNEDPRWLSLCEEWRKRRRADGSPYSRKWLSGEWKRRFGGWPPKGVRYPVMEGAA